MQSEGKIWIILDSQTNKKTKPLSLIQAQMMILTFRVRNLHHYYIWTPGWEEWLPLPRFLSSSQKYFVQSQPPEPLIHKEKQKIPLTPPEEEKTRNSSPHITHVVPGEDLQKIDYGYYYNEVNGEDLTLSGMPEKPSVEINVSRNALGSPKDRRQAPRHDFRIEAVLLTKSGNSFRTYSKNISMTGTLLEDELPKEFIHRPFELILINKFENDPRKNRVHLKGKIIGDIENPRRLMFTQEEEETMSRLKKLMSDYVSHLQRLKKPTG